MLELNPTIFRKKDDILEQSTTARSIYDISQRKRGVSIALPRGVSHVIVKRWRLRR